MGIKKIFKKKDPSESELVDDLQKLGISTKTTNGRQEKFGAFKQYAHERQSQRTGLAPVNPYADIDSSSNNPYASQASGKNLTDDLYQQREGHDIPSLYPGSNLREVQSQSVGNSKRVDPYSSPLHHLSTENVRYERSQNHPQKSNPYEFNARNSSSRTTIESEGDMQLSSASDKYQARSKGRGIYVAPRDDELTLDLNDIPSIRPPIQSRRPVRRTANYDNASLDLNDLPDEDLNIELHEFLSDQEQVNSEDEEVEAIKQDIRFTKQESVALTRNTLRMAQEAEASGTNTLGMLGSQSERLYNAEQNVLLADTQTKIADEKVKELSRLNRSIFIPATGNPFNKKSRLRQQELKLKSDKMQEKYLRDTNRQGMYASEQRLTQGITSKTPNSELFNKYQGEKQIQQAQRYQFENDSEDDEMEKELASNLDQISNYSKKLRSTAKIMGQEVDAQNGRLRRIEEDADRLDINVHLNSSRLNNIR
ncbi:hypothetical protein METBIDRAFT_30306 [Metschnikowia bicuspidata var. bicuspidata NRRL YB-4993]|uniref:t-SNARE coiled-coil homology domain-containing protein n=1 Tax=Metschnikowia bicuspidata var. bicuspidata NRRL YB-4993 TaxID=869754 RepID=A0A1A0HJ84_9ASCO|nr:hypothetical protein METBIDRAFT_30306 [Metschnikowia bicuspidata var. bicuspidata NRRL YB-4993]OBA23947.1 hypothetical protein METBIDRAFT_30306 [Metschnikowia bicuspidata var. bicuspidata NRRL YB-4993]